MPNRSTKNSAGYDIYSVQEGIIHPGESMAFKTGLKVFSGFIHISISFVKFASHILVFLLGFWLAWTQWYCAVVKVHAPQTVFHLRAVITLYSYSVHGLLIPFFSGSIPAFLFRSVNRLCLSRLRCFAMISPQDLQYFCLGEEGTWGVPQRIQFLGGCVPVSSDP